MWSLFRLSINTAPSVLSVMSFWGEEGEEEKEGAMEVRERNTALWVVNLKFEISLDCVIHSWFIQIHLS